MIKEIENWTVIPAEHDLHYVYFYFIPDLWRITLRPYLFVSRAVFNFVPDLGLFTFSVFPHVYYLIFLLPDKHKCF